MRAAAASYRVVRAILAAATLAACVGPSSATRLPAARPPPATPAPDPGGPHAPDRTGPAAARAGEAPAPRLDPATRRLRARAIAAMEDGRLDAAATDLLEVVARCPDDPVSAALLAAILAGSVGPGAVAAKEHDQWLERVAAVEAGVEGAWRQAALPPWRHAAPAPVGWPGRGRAPRLTLASARRNGIVNDHAWFEALGEPRAHDPPRRAWPAPDAVRGLPLARLIEHDDHAVLVYGDGERQVAVALAADDRVLGALDLSAWTQPPGVAADERDFTHLGLRWAEARGGVLYAQHAHLTYAATSRGHNAHLSAIDLGTGALRWRSDPLVANADNFLLRGGWILSGYGFTAERDHVFLLDAADGRVAARARVPSAPEHLALRDRRLHVRCYDTDVVFDLRE